MEGFNPVTYDISNDFKVETAVLDGTGYLRALRSSCKLESFFGKGHQTFPTPTSSEFCPLTLTSQASKHGHCDEEWVKDFDAQNL
eukprot:334136-Amphidinium_carterae.1